HTLEFLSELWGGKYNAVLIPTDGNSISAAFWVILDNFDPDYLCIYQRTWKDLKIARPSQFELALDTQVANFLSRYPTEDEVRVRKQIHEERFALSRQPRMSPI
ncbi:MAG TPA: hypothetical protein VGL29_12760, partial [Blastocatellia bacterium]